MRFIASLAVLVALVACSGQIIDVGTRDAAAPDASAPTVSERCATQGSPDGQGPNIDARFTIAASLIQRTWVLCAGFSPVAHLPSAVEFTPSFAYALKDDGAGRFVRDASERYTAGWGVRYDSFDVTYDGDTQARTTFYVAFEREPVRMLFSGIPAGQSERKLLAIYVPP